MLDSDIKTYHAEEVSSASTNGGKRGYTQVISGVVNNVWANVPKAERLAGSTTYRKMFTVAADDTDGTLVDAKEYIDNPTAAEDWVIAFEGTASDTQADISASARKYGSANIKSDITAGVSTFTVTVEDVSLTTGNDLIFADGDKIRLTDKTTPDATAGNEEFLTISGTPTVSGNDVTITVAESIANGYLSADGARAMALIDIGDVECSVDTFAVTSISGTYDDASYPVITDNIGSYTDSVTLTFTDATNFTGTSSVGLTYGSGTVSADFTPTNPNNSKPYFTLESAGFGGTFASGDTVTFNVVDASFSYWLKRVVPASCSSLSSNSVTSVTTGESS